MLEHVGALPVELVVLVALKVAAVHALEVAPETVHSTECVSDNTWQSQRSSYPAERFGEAAVVEG